MPPQPKGKPPQDDLDFLLATDGEENAADMASWKMEPGTIQASKILRARYQAMVKTLIGLAASSTDGKVAAVGGRLAELGAVIISMGGKT